MSNGQPSREQVRAAGICSEVCRPWVSLTSMTAGQIEHMESQCKEALKDAGLSLVPSIQWEANTRRITISFSKIVNRIECTMMKPKATYDA